MVAKFYYPWLIAHSLFRIICDALGVPRRPSMSARAHTAPVRVAPTIAKDIIIEAEMVAFSEGLCRIDGVLTPKVLIS